MPTGYTYPVAEGETTEFADYARSCMRAFGALVDMKEAPRDAEIPYTIEPDLRYYDQQIARDEAEMRRLNDLSLDELRDELTVKLAAERERWHARYNKRAAEQTRMQAMLEQARAWEPPTEEHVRFKEFMIEQLEMSMDAPGYDPMRFDPFPEPVNDLERWRMMRIQDLAEDVQRERERRQAEIDRAAERTEWVRAILDSLQ